MLEKIVKPDDVKKLSFRELILLAEDVRRRIIEVTSINGGHVAPSLGATDFIIALLKVFNLKHDNIIFDVGHQAYAFKILTERNDRFDTLRTFGGISGFNNRFESEYDTFTVGHASTSISATLGVNIAKQMQGLPGTAIAVIGDGALTGGMVFEALNHAGHLQKDMIVILNDNEMSISPNVGALQHYMTNVLVSRSYNAIKKQVWDLAQSLPNKIRSSFITGAQKMEESLMNIISQNIFFEDLGFKYVGPINGHDIPRMCRIFRQVRENIDGPVLIHLITQKGRGLSYAETDSTKFHGLGSYDMETGKTSAGSELSWSAVFGQKLVELADKNEKVVAITAAMTDGTGLCEFAEKHREKLFDVGIAEQHAITFAAGLAVKGIRPVVAIYSSFLQRAMDQVLHDVALQKLPVVICLDRAGIVGEDGATHQGVFDLSYLSFIPNLTIIAPATDLQLRDAMDWAIQQDEGPVVIRYPRGIAEISQTDVLEKNRPVVVKSNGKPAKITITGIGHSMKIAQLVYDKLISDFPKKSICLTNPLFIKPYDKSVYDDIYQHSSYHFVIEENAKIGGFAAMLSIDYCLSDTKTIPFAIPDEFIQHGSIEKFTGGENDNYISNHKFSDIRDHAFISI